MDEPPRTTPRDVVPIEGRIDAPRPEAELYHHREQRSVFGTDPLDGLPRQVSETTMEDTYVPALDPKTFVCMADTTEFTLESRMGALAHFTIDEVKREDDGQYSVPVALALRRAPESQRHEVQFDLRRGVCFVQPRRPACKHYVRQMTDLAANKDRRVIARFCTALHDESGEFLSLRDGLMYACDLRNPREKQSERLLDDFDAQKIAEGRERQRSVTETDFDVDAALQAQQGQQHADE